MAEIRSARRADYIGFLDRHPYATDAYELGFAVGVREDYRFGDQGYANVDLPVCILDNDFRDPDIDRYLETLAEYEPDVAILGDVYTVNEAATLSETVDDLRSTYPEITMVAVPKCSAALDVFDECSTGLFHGIREPPSERV